MYFINLSSVKVYTIPFFALDRKVYFLVRLQYNSFLISAMVIKFEFVGFFGI